jgi:general secretion pathway protein F
MRFRIRAIGSDRAIAELQLEAADLDAARGLAAGRGLRVLSIEPARSVVSRGNKFPLMLFCQELLALLQAGIPLAEAIDTLGEKEGRAPVRQVIEVLSRDLHEGRPLSSALASQAGVFPDLFVALVRAAERTSDLDQALSRFIGYREQLDALRGRLVSAAIYPVMLLGVGGLVVLFLLGYVVPRFARVFEDIGKDIPWTSKILLDAGSWVGHHGEIALAALVLAVGSIVFLARQPALWQALGRAIWRLPAIGQQLKVFQLARFYRTLGMLLRGGIPAVTSLGMAAELLSPALRPALEQSIAQIREGRGLSATLAAHGLTTPVAMRMLATGERAGNLGEMLERTAAFHEQEIARLTEWLTKLIGPVLMLFIGGVIGLIVVLMYMPIFQLSETLR